MISIANIAPYARDLTILASTKFVQLLVSFSNPAFLLRGESHPRLLNYLCAVSHRGVLSCIKWSDIESLTLFAALRLSTLSSSANSLVRLPIAQVTWVLVTPLT